MGNIARICECDYKLCIKNVGLLTYLYLSYAIKRSKLVREVQIQTKNTREENEKC